MTESSGPSSQPVRHRVTLTGISSRAWEHPADRGALTALRKLKGFDTMLRFLNGLRVQRGVRLRLLGGAVRVDERQFPVLHRLLQEACETLDVTAVPELFVSANPYLNAYCIGLDKPIIVVNSSLVDLLDEEELRFIIGHELGHAVSGHAVYRTMLAILLGLSGIPIAGVAVRLIRAALLEWSRKSELSADRAGLLATQDPATAFRVHMQLASGGHLEELDTTSFFAQGQEYDEGGDLREVMMKLSLLESQTHPFTVVRAAELRRWVDSGDYTRYLAGEYPRRDDDDDASMSDAAQDAARSYSEVFRKAGDAVGKVVHDAAGVVGSVKGWLDETFGSDRPEDTGSGTS